MEELRNQREINQAEWENLDNWSGVWPFNAYFSKRDSRVFVPALWDNRVLSPSTLNMGNRLGPFVLQLMLTLIFGGLLWMAIRN
jgi:hypothetical protein